MHLKSLIRKLLFKRYYVAAYPEHLFGGQCPDAVPATVGISAFGGCFRTGIFDSKKNATRYLAWASTRPFAVLPDRVVRLRHDDPLISLSIFRGA